MCVQSFRFPFDFEIQKIRHCSLKVINGSRQFDVTKENIEKMMNYELFEFEEYCTRCMDIIIPKAKMRRDEIVGILLQTK